MILAVFYVRIWSVVKQTFEYINIIIIYIIWIICFWHYHFMLVFFFLRIRFKPQWLVYPKWDSIVAVGVLEPLLAQRNN